MVLPGDTVAVPIDGVANPGDTVAVPGDGVANPGVVPVVVPGVVVFGAVTVEVAVPGSLFLAQAPRLKISAINRNTVNNFFIS